MVAFITSTVAAAGLNIADLHLGRSPTGSTAMTVLSFDQPVPLSVMEKLTSAPGILNAVAITQE
jgi:predicted regulator of amino acid metabolism with ACT domain